MFSIRHILRIRHVVTLLIETQVLFLTRRLVYCAFFSSSFFLLLLLLLFCFVFCLLCCLSKGTRNWVPFRLLCTVELAVFPKLWKENQVSFASVFRNQVCSLQYHRKGRCRPTCYIRRRIYATCYNIRTRQWRWRWVVRNLPQACTCSTCWATSNEQWNPRIFSWASSRATNNEAILALVTSFLVCM